MKGNCKIQLYDDLTKEEVFSKEQNNFIGVMAKWFIFLSGFSAISSYISNSSDDKLANFSCYNPFEKFVLTDNAEGVETSVKKMPGNEVGYADNRVYAGTNPLRGTININESHLDFDKLVLVFDFATDKANGTFQTVGFKSKSNNPHMMPISYSSGDCLCKDGNTIYYNSGSYLYSYAPKTGQINLISKEFNHSCHGMAFYNDEIYYDVYKNSSSYLYKINVKTKKITKNVMSRYGSIDGVCFDGNYFYFADDYDIYRYDLNFDYVDKKRTSNYWYNLSIGYEGWFMRHDGLEMNINDFYENDVENTRKVLNVGNRYSQILVHNGKIYKNSSEVFFPSVWESGYDYGLAKGLNFGEKYVFGEVLGVWDLGTCIVLNEPITKEDTQTMKVTYTFNIDLPM